MNADDLKKLTTDATDRLAALLDEGHSDQLDALLKAMARFHRYSFHNVCLIAAQCPTATRVAGFHTWRTVGRFVRKGEKGIAILAPIVARRRSDDIEDDSTCAPTGAGSATASAVTRPERGFVRSSCRSSIASRHRSGASYRSS